MKLERLPEYLISALILGIGMLLAVYIGLTAGAGGTRSVVLIVGCVCFLMIGAIFKKNVWLLIPLTGAASGNILQLPFSPAEAGILTAFFWWLIFVNFRQVTHRSAFRLTDFLLILNICYLIVVLVRNPVGLLIFDSDRIGGRPYYSVIIALMGYWVCTRVYLDEIWAQRVPWLQVIGGLPNLLAGVAVRVVPGLAPVTAFVLGIGGSPTTPGEPSTNQRISLFASDSIRIMTALFARFKPSTFINPLYVWRVLALMICCVLVLISGFRNFVLMLVAYFALIAWYRGNTGPVIRTSFLAIPLLCLVLVGQGSLFTLPFGVQRALSFLPAKWEQAPLDSAEDSSEWRYEMWELLLDEDVRYSPERWFGRGFGYSAHDHAKLAYESQFSREAHQDFFMLTGDVHSGPVSSVIFVGYVGTFGFYLLIIGIAVKAHRLIRRSIGTPYEFVALFVGVPSVLFPFFFTFVFGAFNGDLPMVIIRLGMLKMIEGGLTAYYRRQSREAAAPERLAEKSDSDEPGNLPVPA